MVLILAISSIGINVSRHFVDQILEIYNCYLLLLYSVCLGMGSSKLAKLRIKKLRIKSLLSIAKQ